MTTTPSRRSRSIARSVMLVALAACSRSTKSAPITADPSASASATGPVHAAELACPAGRPQGCAFWVRVPRDGGAAMVVDVDDGLSGPLVVAGDSIVTANNGVAATIARRSKSAPDRTQALDWSGRYVRSMTYAKGELVVATEGAIVEVPVDGSPRRTIIETPNPFVVATDGASVAWTDDYSADLADIFVAPIGKGAGKRVARREIDPYFVALDDDGVWWGTYDGTPAGEAIRVMRPGAVHPETIADGQEQILAIATDATDVVWISFVDGHEPIVRRAPKRGGAATEVGRGAAVMRNDRFVHRLVIDGDVVWFSDRTSVLRASKAGGAARVVASVSRAEIASFDVDEDSVWIAAVESP